MVVGHSPSCGTTSATYEYGPFGETIRSTGPIARGNPFRFSTKYSDDESGFSYYDSRYYDPANGRWLNRDDLAEELGGLNLYGFVFNDPLKWVDIGGAEPWTEEDYRRFTRPYFDPSANRYRGERGRFVPPPEFPGRTEQPLPPQRPMPGLPRGGKKDSRAGGPVDLLELAADLFSEGIKKRLIDKGRKRCLTLGRMKFNDCQCCIVFLYKAQELSGRYRWHGGFGNLVQKPCDKAEEELRTASSTLSPTFDPKQQPDHVFIRW